VKLQTCLRLSLPCALLAGLAACATLQGDFEQPTVTVTSFRTVPSAGSALSFEIGLRVVNPNRQALALRGVAYTISLEGRELITGVGKDLPVIEGYSEGTVTLTATASLLEVFQLVGGFMNEPKDRVRYELETTLDVGPFIPAIRVRDSGEISLRP
jgi:LEA14-like dessication related protein